jgi:hypothetical protein
VTSPVTLTPGAHGGLTVVRAQFPDATIDAIPDGAGGEFVVVDPVTVGLAYTTTTTWMGFHINSAYPASDVYPHYIGALSRVDGLPLDGAFQPHTWQGRAGLQVSRRSNRWNPAVDNAALKAEKVRRWIAEQ